MVPKGWSESYLGEVVTYKKGYAFNSSLYAEEGIRIVRISDTTRDSIHSDNPVFIAGGNVEGLEQYSLFENDIILSTVGSRPHLLDSMVGKAVKVPRSAHNSLLNQNLVKLIPKKTKITNEYLFSMLKTKEFIQFISNLVRGNANQVSITLADLFKYKFILPSLPEQKKIAQILSTWDKAISVTEKLLANSQQQKKALMQQLLTGKKRLLDENGVRFSGEWRNSTLSMFCNIAKGKALSASDLEVGDFPVIAGGKSSPYSHSDYTHENVVTVSASGAYAGYISYHNYKIWASDCSVVSAKADNLIDYFYQLLLSLQDKIYSLQSGGAQPHIYPKDLNSIPLWVPCVKEQQKIATVLSAADAEISTLEKKLACLRDEKKALMQQLLTGKRRVKVDEAVAE
ncbi:TPA: restriction endonuclease subunit S [Escherichia coli]|uniref:restriction endonuclease subunit S n=1 Tax=Escherichia coli TaxID=562 RepID=UPI00084E3672|nr:restriction endonuclease subunit S [Escherichia coli]AOR20162.1 type I restriction endonuclease subunit R [Escherichia coli]EHJ8092374.1 restriction endonuclease subunit S [Escherichia coli]EJE3860730.1 restriction endonuclease subunit S [Escherichia coli]EJY6845735.1 restriction endonuclease subunit S [Escherichia coli]EKG0210270.1 restriction endonuclease subunit S [Escherichia coli]